MREHRSPIVWTSIEDLVDQIFGCRRSEALLPALRDLETEREEVRAFVARWLRLMSIAGIEPRRLSPSLVWSLGKIVPTLLPGAWGNVVPPFTVEDRHAAIDRYLVSNPWAKLPELPVMLEMGCGFPPQTAIDTARRFPGFQVIGVDLQFDPFILYDAEGNYACMNAGGQVRYFHPASQNMA